MPTRTTHRSSKGTKLYAERDKSGAFEPDLHRLESALADRRGILHPAFIEATEEEDIHHAAVFEQDGAKKLIVEIEASQAGDDYFDAKVTVLSEMIKHHVEEKEHWNGLGEQRSRIRGFLPHDTKPITSSALISSPEPHRP
jgi:hypothetical protein